METIKDAAVAVWWIVWAGVVMLVIGVLNAFVVSSLWGWFVVPLGMPSIGIAHAWGLGILVGMFQFPPQKLDDDEAWWRPIVQAVTRSLVALGVGLVVASFM